MNRTLARGTDVPRAWLVALNTNRAGVLRFIRLAFFSTSTFRHGYGNQ